MVTKSSQSTQTIEQLSSHFVRDERCPGDMDDDQFNEKCAAYLASLQLSRPQIASLESNTVKMSEHRKFAEDIKYRLTASNFGRVCQLPDSDFRGDLVADMLLLTPTPNYYHEDATDYGRESVRKAIYAYQRENQHVTFCGIFVHPEFGYLAASPNGLVGDRGIVAVRSPYFARFLPPLLIPTDFPEFYCSLSNDRTTLVLDTQHKHYYQIQGQLEITDREWCDFVVWTPQGIHVERIYRDRDVFFFNAMLPKLERFYKLSLLPEIVDARLPRELPIREPDFVFEALENERNAQLAIEA